MTPATHQLDYGTQPRRFRRWLRLFALLLLIACVTIIVAKFHRKVQHWWTWREYSLTSQRWYSVAANHLEQSTILKYTDNLADAPAGGFRCTCEGVGYQIFRDPISDRIPSMDPEGNPILSDTDCVLFVHERTTAAGLSRIVIISPGVWTGTHFNMLSKLVGRVPGRGYLPMYDGCVTLDLTGLAAPRSLRIFAGQIDPKDSAKFYVPFESGGRQGRFNGVFVAGNSLSQDPKIRASEIEMGSNIEWSISLNPPKTDN